MRIVKCGYCRGVVAELPTGTRIMPYTLMLCQACAKKVGLMVAKDKLAAVSKANEFDNLFGSIFGRKT